MKKFKLILFSALLMISSILEAQNFYVSPTGNDSNPGTQALPWRNISKAIFTVRTPGSTVYFAPGTYNFDVQLNLAVGVSLIGSDSSTTIIRCNRNDQIFLQLASPEGTNGNQVIAGLQFDGENLKGFKAIRIMGRSNVTIRNCWFRNFREDGIYFTGRNDYQDIAPTIYARNNSFHDNVVNNCAKFETNGRGGLNFGGQTGMRVYNNTITQTERPLGQNGFPIKYGAGGHNRALKLYNNTIIKVPSHTNYPYQNGNGWDFAIELWDTHSGSEIYNNVIIGGALDIHHNRNPLDSAYSVWVHDNQIYNTTPNPNWENGIIIEGAAVDMIIERNVVYNKTQACYFNTQQNETVRNVVFRNNLFYNIGRPSREGYYIYARTEGVQDKTRFVNVRIQNNTFSPLPGGENWSGIRISNENNYASVDSLYIQNNIILGQVLYGVQLQASETGGRVWYQNNNLFGNGNSNEPNWQGAPPTFLVASGNLKNDPLFVPGATYALQPSSPLIDGGVNIGRPFSGLAPDIGYIEAQNNNVVAASCNLNLSTAAVIRQSTVTVNNIRYRQRLYRCGSEILAVYHRWQNNQWTRAFPFGQ